MLKSGTWYLLAVRDGVWRTYRISRVEEAEILEATFSRSAGFDLAAVWAETLRGFRARGAAEEVRVRLRPGASGLFWRMAAEHLSGEVANGVATLVFPSLPAAAAFVAGYVGEVEVLTPAALRTRLGEIGRALVQAYRGPRRGRGEAGPGLRGRGG